MLAGTGLTHLGSAEGRDKMHKAASSAEKPTDSMRMFLMGVEGGKPKPGDGRRAAGMVLQGRRIERDRTGSAACLAFLRADGGEEPEIAAIYVIGPDGTPFRLGFALGNEFSDHVTEREQLSVAGAFQAAAGLDRPRTADRAAARPCRGRLRAFAATAR